MNAERCLEVWRVTEGVWTWLCTHTRPAAYGLDYPTHAEALAAALAHCAKKAAS